MPLASGIDSGEQWQWQGGDSMLGMEQADKHCWLLSNTHIPEFLPRLLTVQSDACFAQCPGKLTMAV